LFASDAVVIFCSAGRGRGKIDTATGDTVAVTKDKPYERVDSHIADMRYDPERKNLLQQHVGDTITLDREMYKIVEITSNAVRVESARTKVTEIKWNRTP